MAKLKEAHNIKIYNELKTSTSHKNNHHSPLCSNCISTFRKKRLISKPFFIWDGPLQSTSLASHLESKDGSHPLALF